MNVTISEELLKSAISVIDDLLESAMMDVVLANDGRKSNKVYGGELMILHQLKDKLESKADSKLESACREAIAFLSKYHSHGDMIMGGPPVMLYLTLRDALGEE